MFYCILSYGFFEFRELARRERHSSCCSLARACCHMRKRGDGRYTRPRCGVVSKPLKYLSMSGLSGFESLGSCKRASCAAYTAVGANGLNECGSEVIVIGMAFKYEIGAAVQAFRHRSKAQCKAGHSPGLGPSRVAAGAPKWPWHPRGYLAVCHTMVPKITLC